MDVLRITYALRFSDSDALHRFCIPVNQIVSIHYCSIVRNTSKSEYYDESRDNTKVSISLTGGQIIDLDFNQMRPQDVTEIKKRLHKIDLYDM